MDEGVRHLGRVVPAEGTRPGGAGEDHPMRIVTRQIAFEPGGWTPERAARVTALFDGLAGEWHTRSSEPRLAVVADALDRGGPLGRQRWLELGSGTGLVTPTLAARAGLVVAVDLSAAMLAAAPAGPGARVRADGAALPVADASLDAVVLVNAFLFPAETARVLRPDGAVVWVNTSGPATPIHLSAGDVVAALDAATAGPGTTATRPAAAPAVRGARVAGWAAVASEAAWGTWAVVRRTGAPGR